MKEDRTARVTLTREQKTRCDALALKFDVTMDTVAHLNTRKRLVQKSQGMLNAAIEPSVIPARSKRNKIVLVLDILCFLFIDRVAISKIIADATPFRAGGLVHKG